MRGRGIALVAGARMGQARAEQAAAQQAAQQAPQAAAAPPASTDTAAEIQKLADLHASGALTDEEFAAMKKKLLGL
jgi:membrane protease subunit (stomatin/prohibitin family)